MEEDHIVTVHSTLTALSVAVGRLDEQIKAMRNELLNHTTNEHKSFDQALQVVSEIKEDVAQLQELVDQGKGAWMALAKIAAVIISVSGVIAFFFNLFFHPR